MCTSFPYQQSIRDRPRQKGVKENDVKVDCCVFSVQCLLFQVASWQHTERVYLIIPSHSPFPLQATTVTTAVIIMFRRDPR